MSQAAGLWGPHSMGNKRRVWGVEEAAKVGKDVF